MTTKHTAGDWYQFNATDSFRISSRGFENELSVTVHFLPGKLSKAVANAKLIVAAPNLLKEFAAFVAKVKHHDCTQEGCETCASVRVAQAAIDAAV